LIAGRIDAGAVLPPCPAIAGNSSSKMTAGLDRAVGCLIRKA
jgi:hypothetical protein